MLFLALAWEAHATIQFPNALRANSESIVEPVTISFQSGGTLAEIRVLTGGVANADYILKSTGSCIIGFNFTVPASCSVLVTFQPKAPGGRLGAVVLLDASGTVLAVQSVYGIGTGPLGVFLPATITTIAGNGQWLYVDDGHLATGASIFLPGGVAVDPTGNVYIADSGNNRIRRVDAVTGLISTVAGTGSPSSGNDGGPAIAAGVSAPSALILDGAGDLYIADSANHAVRKLSLAAGTLSTVAGRLNQQGYSGDGGLATAANLNTPEGLALDAAGNLYIADTKNHVVRKVDAVSGIITTYAGQGPSAGFSGDGGPATKALLNTPWGLATDLKGDLFIADLNNNRIREVASDGTISTVVGVSTNTYGPDGQGTTSISNPAAVVVDVAGNIYFADSGRNLVRRLSATTKLLDTIAGYSLSTFNGDGGPAPKAGLYGPYALTLDSAGNLYVADIFHHRIREVVSSQATLSYAPIRVGRTSTPQQQTIENDGNGDLNWTSFDPDSNSAVGSAITTCAVGTPLAFGATCSLGAEFFPQVTGTKVTAAIQLRSDAVNSPGTITLSGEVDQLEPTRISVASSTNPSALGAGITFTASVTGDSQQPSGNVRFFDNTTLLGSAAADSSGTAVFAIATLGLGSHAITANFTGDTLNSPSTSAVLTQIVKRSPVVALASSLNPAKVGNSITLTAAVTATGVQPAGTVIFSDGVMALATVPLNGSGVANFVSTSLAAGTHALTAIYSGDANTLTGTSSIVSETVNRWATSTAISSSAAISDVGTQITFFLSVTSTSTVVPFGPIVVKDGLSTLATLNLDPSGSASFSTSSLSVGSHALTASFAGDPTNANSDSSVFTQSVRQISTVTTLASSANPSNGGALLHLSATVTPNSTNAVAGTLDGTVTFLDGSTGLGAGTLAADGSFTLDISTLAAGSHTLKAVYSGDTNYAPNSSAGLVQVVKLATTSVQLTSSTNPTIAGKGITLTGVVAGNGAVPGGTVTFLDGTTDLGNATVNLSGQANLTLSSLPAGSHTLTASYGGDTKDSPSTSAALTEVVNPATTALTLISSSNPATAGTAITFVATLSSNGNLPSGQLLLQEGSATLGTAIIGPTGAAQFSLNTLSASLHTLTVSFAGDTDHVASVSTPLVETVQLAPSAAMLVAGANPTTVGTAVNFTAKITGTGQQPTGSAAFHDGATLLGVAPLDSTGSATISTPSLSIGSHTITLTYSGDATHAASNPAALIERVQQATTTALVSSGSPSLVGTLVTFTATVVGSSGSSVAGTVSFADGATLLGTSPISNAGSATLQIASLTAGQHLITAQYAGDENDRGSVSAPLSQAINTADTTITVTSSANPSVVGSAVTFTAAVVSRGQSANGVVTFLDGSLPLGTGIVTSAMATFSTTSLRAGSHAIIARYGGDSGTQVSTSGVLLQVAQQHTTSSLASSTNPALTVESVTLAATVGNGSNPGGTFTFLDGGTVLGTGTVRSSGTAAITVPSLSAGPHSLSAHYSGDNYNLASDSASVTEVVQLRPSNTSITASSQTYLDGQQVTLVAVAHFTGPVPPTGSITFTSGGQTLGTSNLSVAGAATLILAPSASSYDIVASYTGDSVYSGSTADRYTITKGSSTTFNLTSNPSEVSLKSGDHKAITVTMSGSGSFSDTLSLACLDLPADATCTFSQNQTKLAAGGVATVQLVLDTGHPLGSGAQAQIRLAHNKEPVRAGTIFPAAVLMGILVFAARRRRHLPSLLSLVLLAITGISLSGCGNSLNTSTTPAGSYNVRIIATGSITGISQIINVAVTVQ